MQLYHFDVGVFLSQYWQKKPLLIRKAWASWSNPLAPDELAGLACEEEIESRLIRPTHDSLSVEHGPIPEGRFQELGDTPWTLLVQSVDQFVPEVAALLEPFRFVPNWRVDDVMVSYATDGGGVGPHFDQYDVFLVQGMGRRRWRVGQRCGKDTVLLPHDELRLLASFEAIDEWILEPGDILYVPPGVAHEGVAVGRDCMTYSIGFRAPSRAELVAGWSEDVFNRLTHDDRYSDPDLAAQDNPGEIAPEAVAKLHAMATENMLDLEAFGRWFGQYSTSRKVAGVDWQPEQPVDAEQVRRHVAEGTQLCRNQSSRFSFVREQAGLVLLFVDGQCFECREESAPFAELLCAQSRVRIDPRLAQSEAAISLTTQLWNQGSVTFDGDD